MNSTVPAQGQEDERTLWAEAPRQHSERCVFERLTCPDIVHSLGCSDCCFSQFPPNVRTDSGLKQGKGTLLINCF